MSLSKFTTQNSLKLHFKQLIKIIGICDSIKTKHNDYYIEFCELFKRHSDYPHKFIGMIDIFIKNNPKYPTQLMTFIRKEDGTEDDVSVLSNCITGKPKNNLIIAMRIEIHPYIEEYRKNNRLCCELCSSLNYAEVDHHSELAPFAKLVDDFMKINKLPIPIEFDNTKWGPKCFRESDKGFRDSWIEYHNKHMILRILCKKCNGSQPKYKSKN